MATFEELTGLDTSTPAERPLNNIHQSGSDVRRQLGEEQAKRAEETTVGGTFGAAWERNISNMVYDTVQRKWTHMPEDNFDATAWVAENRESLPGRNIEAFSSVRSTGEAEELRADMIRADENDKVVASKGYTGVAASLITGLVDPAEIAVAVGTAGYGKAATVGGRIARVTASGLKGGAASGALAYGVDPLADSKQVVFGALSGAVLSGSLSTAGQAFNRASMTTRRAYSQEVNDLPSADRDVTHAPAYDMRDNMLDLDNPSMDPSGSVGAARVNYPFKVPEGLNPTAASIYEQAMRTLSDNDVQFRMIDTDFTANTPEARVAKRFSDVLSQKLHTELRTDFDRLMYGGSRIEASMAFNLFESPEGRLRNNTSAAMLNTTYEQRLSSKSLPFIEDSYSAWAQQRGMGTLDRHRPSTRTAFDREVFAELEARFHEGAPVSTDPAIRKAADAIDDNMRDAVEVGRGRPGENSIDGFEDMQPKSGFIRHKWNGAAIKQAIAKGHSKGKIERVLSKGYAKTYPEMPSEYRTMLSKAVVRRALANEDGVDTNMLKTLDSDAQEYLRDMLLDSGYNGEVVESLIDSIRGRSSDNSKLSTTKERKQIDLRTEEDGLSLLDLVDTNLTRLISTYNREVSGNAALARKGILNRSHRKDMIEAALAERRASGLPSDEKQRRFLEDMFTYFDSGPIAGGVDPGIARLKRITNLSLLNQMGMTQAGEAGAQIAAVGMETWQKHAKSVFKQMRTQGPDGPIAQELRPWMGDIGNEHMLFRDDLMLDELSTARDLNTFLGKLDFALGKGQRLQGYVSGFYHVRQFQQRVAVTSMADKVMQRLRDGTDLEVLDGIGMPQGIKKYIDNGTVTFDADGFVDKLNMSKWSPDDAEGFALSLNRHTHQVVQKAMAGEEQVLLHKTVGSLYMHLKSFPLLAMRKQTARLAGVQRPQMVAALVMGLATAGLAFEARQLINGRTDRISGEDALRGAMGMSNMTGWVPMLTDPAAAILGMNDLRFNQYGRHDINTGILSVPPVLPTLNRMAQLPGAANPWGDLTQNERIRILQSTPIVGNLYGFSALFNGMKN